MNGSKIVATVGPASDSESVITKLLHNGVSTLRINTAHIEAGYIKRISDTVTRINEDEKSFMSVLVDLKGPELRTGEFPGGQKIVEYGKVYTIGSEGSDIAVNYPDVLTGLSKDDRILISDGRVSMSVISSNGRETSAKAMTAATIRDRSRINVPGKILDLGILTERDRSFIDESIANDVDFFALSFVQKKENVIDLRRTLLGEKSSAHIVSKIETKSGLQNISGIAKVSDWIMVARGDLGVELPLEEVTMAQKSIIIESHKFGVPTIVATQMLESMVNNSTPTRAEVSDITNAIMDNADALMLSEETAIGKYPVEAASYLNRVSRYVESRVKAFPEPVEFLGNNVAFSIAKAAKMVSDSISADGILVFTKTGSTARMISAVRPHSTIYAAVTDRSLARKLNLLKGMVPIMMQRSFESTRSLNQVMDYIYQENTIKFGSRVVVTSGSPYFLFGGTTDMRVLTIGDYVGRGYATGKKVTGKYMADGTGEIIVSERFSKNLLQRKETKAMIIRERILADDIETISKTGITVVQSARFVRDLKDGEEIMIDPGTGVIVSNSRSEEIPPE
jgi:pyruvate kinase